MRQLTSKTLEPGDEIIFYTYPDRQIKEGKVKELKKVYDDCAILVHYEDDTEKTIILGPAYNVPIISSYGAYVILKQDGALMPPTNYHE